MRIFRLILNQFTNPDFLKELTYLYLTFPLGLLYFVVLVIGFSIGTILSIIGIGLLLLALVLVAIQFGRWFELMLAEMLLNADVDTSFELFYDREESLYVNIHNNITNRQIIFSLIFLLLKLPLGIITLVLLLSPIFLPIVIIFAPYEFDGNGYDLRIGHMQVDTATEANIISAFGFILFPLSLLLLRFVARVWRVLAIKLLNPREDKEKAKNQQKRKLKNSELIEDYEFYDEEDEWEDEVVSLGALVNDAEGVYRNS